jgi:hypothetical protein
MGEDKTELLLFPSRLLLPSPTLHSNLLCKCPLREDAAHRFIERSLQKNVYHPSISAVHTQPSSIC